MTWLTVKEATSILNYKDESTVQKAAKSGWYDYEYVKGYGQGGKQMIIALETLPEEAQARYHGQQQERDNTAYLYINADQRRIVDHKLVTVHEYKDFKAAYPGRDKMQAFLEEYNAQHPELEKPLTKRQLNHWEKCFDRDGLSGLVDRRGGHNKGKSDIPDDVWDTFKALYFKESRPTALSCYEMVVRYFEGRDIPHYKAFQRRLETVPQMALDYYRKGEKYYKDHYEPYMEIDYSKMHSNQEWVADHHIFDVLVENEKGEVFRPWLSAWIDRKSRCFMGYVVNQTTPNGDIVLDSFAKACYAQGIPESVLLDNGKDYKVYDLFNNSNNMSVARQLNILVRNARPYNAKAKPIERVFGTLEGRYCKHLPSYIGNDGKKRPQSMNATNAKLAGKVMPYGEFCAFVSDMIQDYNNHPHRGLGGGTPQNVYNNSFTVRRRVVSDRDTLFMFLMRTSKPLTVGRNGINLPLLGLRYDDEALAPYIGKTVYARYNTEDVAKVYIFDEKDNFLCMASCARLAEYGGKKVSAAMIRETNNKKKQRNKLVKQSMALLDTPTVQEHVAYKTLEFPYQAGPVDEIVQPVKHKQAGAIKKERARQKAKSKPAARKVANGILTQEDKDRYFAHMLREEAHP